MSDSETTRGTKDLSFRVRCRKGGKQTLNKTFVRFTLEDKFGTKNEHTCTCRSIYLFHKVLTNMTNIGTLKPPHTHRKIEKWNLFSV